MLGHITRFHDDIGFGVIRCDDGRKFRFSRSEIFNPGRNLVGLDVDFLLESRKPKDIVLLHGSPWAAFARTNSFSERS